MRRRLLLAALALAAAHDALASASSRGNSTGTEAVHALLTWRMPMVPGVAYRAEEDAQARRLRDADDAQGYTNCSSLLGPTCPAPRHGGDADEDAAQLLASPLLAEASLTVSTLLQAAAQQVNDHRRRRGLEAVSAQEMAERRTREVLANRQRAAQLQGERAARRGTEPGRGAARRGRADGEWGGSRGDVAALPAREAVLEAAERLRCPVCRALTLESFWMGLHAGQAAAAARHGSGVSVARLEGQLREVCVSAIPPPMQRWAVVPTADGDDFALAARAEGAQLTPFDLSAFKAACALVVSEASEEVATAAARTARLAMASGALTVEHVRAMQEDACTDPATDMCRPAAAAEASGAGDRRARDGSGGGGGDDDDDEEEEKGRGAAAGARPGWRPRPVAPRLRDGPCVYLAAGWWTTQICAGRAVVQYHTEGHVVVASTLVGRYSAAATAAANAAAATTRTPRRLEAEYVLPGLAGKPPAFYEEVFLGGDACGGDGLDATAPRRAEVRWVCSVDGLLRVLPFERRKCDYLFVVYTSDVCDDEE